MVLFLAARTAPAAQRDSLGIPEWNCPQTVQQAAFPLLELLAEYWLTLFAFISFYKGWRLSQPCFLSVIAQRRGAVVVGEASRDV